MREALYPNTVIIYKSGVGPKHAIVRDALSPYTCYKHSHLKRGITVPACCQTSKLKMCYFISAWNCNEQSIRDFLYYYVEILLIKQVQVNKSGEMYINITIINIWELGSEQISILYKLRISIWSKKIVSTTWKQSNSCELVVFPPQPTVTCCNVYHNLLEIKGKKLVQLFKKSAYSY